jgi:hypothetical protein
MAVSDPIGTSGAASRVATRPEDEVDTSNLASQVALSGNLDLARSFVGTFPEQRNTLDAALMSSRNFSLVNQLATDGAQPQQFAQATPLAQTAAQTQQTTPQTRLMPERQVTAFQSTNAKAMAADQATLTHIAGSQQKLAAAQQTDLTVQARNKTATLDTTLKTASAFLGKDAQLRQTAADAIKNSTYPKGELGKDPAVVAAIHGVESNARTRPSSTAPDALAKTDRSIAGLKRADVPEWVHYNALAGPRYPDNPERKIGTSPAWQGLINAGQATDSVQRVVSRMADNEGALDAVQAYDNQIASLGAMQKTISPAGNGELAKQVAEFSQSNPAKYQSLFASQGWTSVHSGTGTGSADYTMSYQNPSDPKAQPLTGPALSSYIRQPNDPARWQETLGPLFRAGRDTDFQQKQIGDFVGRLDSSLAKVPSGTYTQPISSYLTSEQSAALVLDQDVNRPAYVAADMGSALDTFYAANPKANPDPTQWTAQERATYEPQIVTDYTNVRRMTDSDARAQHITGAGTTLSALPGSLVRATPPVTTNTP